jgi:hypothetical protein
MTAPKQPSQPHLFVLYDARARGGNTDDACVLVACNTEKEARQDSKLFMNQGAIWYQYDTDRKDNKTLINGKKRDDIPTDWKAYHAWKRRQNAAQVM